MHRLRLLSDRRGLLPREILFLTVFVVGFIGVLIFAVRFEDARARDNRRLADMRTVQQAFVRLWLDRASYRSAADNGCGETGVRVHTCNLTAYEPRFASLRDPGDSAYIVTRVPNDEGYTVQFTIERTYGTLKRGVHTLTERGIQ